MADGWAVVVWLAITAAVIRAAGPVALGGRALLPFAPAGVPVIAASGAALIGLRSGGATTEREHPEIEEDPVG